MFKLNDPVQYRDTFNLNGESVETLLNGYVIDVVPEKEFSVKVWFPELDKNAPNGLTFTEQGQHTSYGPIVLFHKN